MKWPSRLLTDIAAEGTYLRALRSRSKITVRIVKLGLSLRYRADQGQTLTQAVDELGFTRRYGRAVCQLFNITFPDFAPRNPDNLPLE